MPFSRHPSSVTTSIPLKNSKNITKLISIPEKKEIHFNHFSDIESEYNKDRVTKILPGILDINDVNDDVNGVQIWGTIPVCIDISLFNN
mmetsp:Transcript_61715/g.75672  ORF Transcript_61715/g.75672 Transcript_61715/m.75672 type:complete len:89 (-) Transcript_61715:76-342(-)